MDPATMMALESVAVSLASGALQGGVQALLTRSLWRRSVAKRVAREVGKGWVARPLRAWLGDKSAWPVIAAIADGSALDPAISALAQMLGKDQPALPADDCRRLARDCLAVLGDNMLRDLPPSWAIDLHDRKMLTAFAELKALVTQEETFAEAAAKLPPYARRAVDQLLAVNPVAARDLVAALLQGDETPVQRLAALLTPPLPPILANGPALAWAVMGEYAAAHLQAQSAARCFAEAARLAAPGRARWMARAALSSNAENDTEATAEHMGQARAWSAGLDPLVSAVDAFLRKDWNAVEETAAEAILDGTDDPILILLASQASWLAEKKEQAIRWLRDLVRRDASASGALIQLSKFLHFQALEGPGVNRAATLREAIGCAVRARDLRRLWQGPGWQAVEVACDAALALDDIDLAIRLVSGPPAGDANDDELASPYALALRSADAAARGETDEAEDLLARINDPFHKSLAAAGIAWARDESTNEVIEHLLAAHAAAGEDPMRQLRALGGLVQRGHWPLPGFAELERKWPSGATLLRATSELRRHEYAAAIQRLRPHWQESQSHVDLLAEAYVAQGQVLLAVDVLTEAADYFQAPELRARAAEWLFLAGSASRAEELATVAAAGMHDDSPQRRRVRRLLIDLAGKRRDWVAIAERARTYLADDPGHKAVRWGLVTSLAKELELSAAWAAADEGELDPRNDNEAALWLALARRHAKADQWVPKGLDLVTRYPESLDVAATFLHVTRTVEPASIPPGIAQKVKDTTAAIMQRFPDNEHFRVISMADPDAFTELMRDMLLHRARTYDAVTSEIRSGRAAVGQMVAAGLGPTYTQCLLYGLPEGWRTHLAMADSSDAAAAAAALNAGHRIVIDVSSLTTASLIPDAWPTIAGEFHRILFSSAARSDIFSAVDDLRGSGAVGTMQLEAVTGNLKIVGHVPGVWAPYLARAEWMWAVCRRLRMETVDAITVQADIPNDERFLPWLAGVEIALAEGLPLVCDDVWLRLFAREKGVSAFPLSQLVRLLVEQHKLPPALPGSPLRGVITAR